MASAVTAAVRRRVSARPSIMATHSAVAASNTATVDRWAGSPTARLRGASASTLTANRPSSSDRALMGTTVGASGPAAPTNGSG